MKRLFTALAVLLMAGAVISTPAQATPKPPIPVGRVVNLSNCYTNSICAYPSVTTWPAGSPWVINRDAADTPRNTCFAEFGTTLTYAVINNSKYEWWLFRTTTCNGSHIAVDGFNEIQTPDDWHAIHAWMRTSTVN